METIIVVTAGLALLAVVSGMLGLGVAFAAIPFLALAVPISVLSGFLGVGPGFLLMPALMIAGFNAKKAAGINAFAVTPPSFSALIPHMATAHFDPTLTVVLLVAGAAGSFVGARLTSLYMPSARIKQLFGVLIVVMTLFKIWTLQR
jgi:hypothetical protein